MQLSKATLDSHYAPFGMLLVGRTWSLTSAENYRYGFDGQEQDDEVYGNGNLNSAEFWIYDTRLGRRWNLDLKGTEFLSKYVAFQNNPIAYIDSPGDTAFYFNSEGYFLRMDPELTIFGKDGIIIENANSYSDAPKGVSSYYTFNDQNGDVKRMLSLISWSGTLLYDDAVPLIYFYSDNDINNSMKKAGTDEKKNGISRFLYAQSESEEGKMDFWWTQLVPEARSDGHDPNIKKDINDGGPFYIFNNNLNEVYNIMDAGNWLWGLAMSNIGFTYREARTASRTFARLRASDNDGRKNGGYDSAEDQNAIKHGFHYTKEGVSEQIDDKKK